MANTLFRDNSFEPLLGDLKIRLATPVGQVTFWVFLVIGILVCGGTPIWVEAIKLWLGFATDTENLRTAINCYFPAIGGAAAAQLMFAGRQKYLTSFSFFAAFFFFISSILTLLLGKFPATRWTWAFGLLAAVLAILMWWIANGLDETFRDNITPDAAVGGSPRTTLVGDTKGFTT